jgi:hypothetical protein
MQNFSIPTHTNGWDFFLPTTDGNKYFFFSASKAAAQTTRKRCHNAEKIRRFFRPGIRDKFVQTE